MNRVIDLHGYQTEEATIIVENALFDYQNHKVDHITFVTGKGGKVMETVVGNLLDKKRITYSYQNQGGAIIVSRHLNDYLIFDEDEEQQEYITNNELEEIFESFSKN
ncbi:Smr/MutS family protein [Mycoplasma corogypsi]|uniref:Smr/MutS family protein n=1 Tax=Mycoplasma corogypsi TaxID=2106 RepID=UPI003872EB3F